MTTQQTATPHEQAHTPPASGHGHGHGANVRVLVLAALGVVFGDIGTSPLYALKECVHSVHGVRPTHDNILGLLSLITWSLVMVVTIKYLTFIMRADNGGEGGILALLALVPEKMQARGARVGWIAAIVIFGAALLYGDGIITPAISVLSAIEGLEVATSSLKPLVIPITCVILILLFGIQQKGTAGIGKVFGPVMVLWFGTLATLGVIFIVKNPSVLWALSPVHAVSFFREHGMHGFGVLGSVVLVITGGEALYADMGHFGRRPIRIAWYGFVLPALLLNYYGQGALLLQSPEAAESPFFALVPKGGLTYALVGLSTMATVIASQALISGAYSLTHQAVQLGFLPRVTVKHTSSETEGQIYIPEVNWALAIACVALVLMFKESGKLAAAYGIAVTGTMGITSIVYFVVVRKTWGWSLAKALPLLVLFLIFDFAFFGANLLKFIEGGYVPILVGMVFFGLMVTWKRGRALLAKRFSQMSVPLSEFLSDLDARCRFRVPGAAVFMTSNAVETPPILVHHVRHNKVLHETVVLLTVITEHIPRVADAECVDLKKLDKGFYRLLIRRGFMQFPNVPRALEQALAENGLPIELKDTTYYLGRETFLATEKGEMGPFAENIFAYMVRNAQRATAYFNIPPDRVVELGIQVDL